MITSVEDNKAFVIKLVEAINSHDIPSALSFIATDCIEHTFQMKGPEGFEKFLTLVFAGFPDFSVKVEDIIAKLRPFFAFDIRVIYNPFYDCSDNLISLWLALPYVSSGFILINADVVFDYRILSLLERDTSDICIPIRKKEYYKLSDSKVKINLVGLKTKIGPFPFNPNKYM